jgi:phosphatidylinositol-bisphosphatase
MPQRVWEVTLQEQIGPTHVKYSSYYHGSVGVAVFIRRELIWFCSVAEYEHINLRAGPINTPSATKASVCISFQLFGTLMCFICSHFAAGEGAVEARIDNYKSTINGMKLPNRLLNKKKVVGADATDNFDCVFWFGDFNFRVDKEKSKVVSKILDKRNKRSINFEDIMNHDELYRVITEGF